MRRVLKIDRWAAESPLFRNVPEGIYAEGSPAISQGATIPTAFLSGCFVLIDRDKAVARASLYRNPELRLPNGAAALTIGNYECVDGDQYGEELLAALVSAAKSENAGYLIGPMNGSTWESYRLPDAADHPPFLLEPDQPLYYHRHFQRAGFSSIAAYYSSTAPADHYTSDDLLLTAESFRQMGVTFRPVDLNRYEQELRRIHKLANVAFARNFLFTPISEQAFIEKYSGMARWLHPELTLLAEDNESNLIGVYFCMDDILNKTNKTLIFKTLARHPSPQWRGLGRVMGHHICQKAIDLHYETFIHALIYHNGTSRKLSDDFGGKPYKTYTLYGKEIT